MEQMSVMDNSRSSLAGLTLEALLFGSKPPSQQDNPHDSRTLSDIIRDEERHKEKKSWKNFKEKLRLKRAVAALTSSSHTPALNRSENSIEHVTSAGPSRPSRVSTSIDHRERANVAAPADCPPPQSLGFQISRPISNRFPGSDEAPPTRQLGTILAEERVLSAPEGVTAAPSAEEQAEPARISLMELLVETDRGMGLTGSSYAMGDVDSDAAAEISEESRGIDEHMCCVCMVRNKGSAFIPCGHTFCRLCSRELWVQRGNCPLCNGFITEILDIF